VLTYYLSERDKVGLERFQSCLGSKQKRNASKKHEGLPEQQI
jgi:hypothetical protein